MPEHILSLSYGKDSMACFGACELLGWPIDRVVTAEVWATDTIPADLPPMVEFKAKADKIIKERWGIEVEHVKGKNNYQDLFYRKKSLKAKHNPGEIRGGRLLQREHGAKETQKCHHLKQLRKVGTLSTSALPVMSRNAFTA